MSTDYVLKFIVSCKCKNDMVEIRMNDFFSSLEEFVVAESDSETSCETEEQRMDQDPTPSVRLPPKKVSNRRVVPPVREAISSNKRKKQYPQNFRHEWLMNPAFRRWLRSVEGDRTAALCTLCQKILGAKLSTLNYHAFQDKKHEALIASLGPDFNDYEEDIEKGKACLKIMFCNFFSDKLFAISIIDPLLEFMKYVSRKFPLALQALKFGRTYLTEVVNKEYSPYIKDELTKTLMNGGFSVLFDESTDKSSTKHGAVQVRYVNNELGKIMTSLYCLPEVVQ